MKKAYTLVEILVVLTVVAILVGVAVPRFKGMGDESSVAKVKLELGMLNVALQAYYGRVTPNAFPPTTTTVGASYLIQSVPQSITSILYDPFGATATSEYNYIRSDNGAYYVICSAGPDKASETGSIADDGVVTIGGDDVCASNGSMS